MDKKKLQMVIIGLVIFLLGGTFSYFKYLLWPMNARQKVVQEEMKNLKKDYTDAVRKAARLSVLQQEIKLLGEEISKMEKKLPKNKDVAKLIRMLAKKMDDHNISFGITTTTSQTLRRSLIRKSECVC